MENNPLTQDNKNIDMLINDQLETDINEDDLLSKNEGIYSLSSGRALTLSETYEITASQDTKLIILVGPSASGKTTIEATIYQIFQNGKVGNYYFAGSKTLQGYEQRSFYTRTKSKLPKPSTTRTSLGSEEIFLHLKLWNYNDDRYVNYLFADLSGEDFENHIADIDSICRDFHFIKYADYIIAVIDGNAISLKEKRNGAFAEISLIMRTIIDAKLYNANTKLQVVFSKYDILDKNFEKDDTINRYINRIKIELEKCLEIYNKPIEYYNIAAMPEESGKFKVGYGIKELIDSWNKNSSNIYDSLIFRKFIKNKNVNSEFDKLFYKLLGDNNG